MASPRRNTRRASPPSGSRAVSPRGTSRAVSPRKGNRVASPPGISRAVNRPSTGPVPRPPGTRRAVRGRSGASPARPVRPASRAAPSRPPDRAPPGEPRGQGIPRPRNGLRREAAHRPVRTAAGPRTRPPTPAPNPRRTSRAPDPTSPPAPSSAPTAAPRKETIMNTGELVDLGQQLRVDSVRASAAAGSGAPDLVDVRRGPDGRTPGQPPPLRLRAPRPPRQRPLRALQGARLAAALLRLQGGRRHRRRGTAHLPQAGQPP
ncbi:hypothetical protein STENM36S_07813 [Streptomyces tendae]